MSSAFPPIDKSFAGMMRDILMRLGLVERRLAVSGGGGIQEPTSTGTITEGSGVDITGGGTVADPYVLSTWRGTTAQRNTIFGVPATDAERVALANQKVNWFNTDLGWVESYYAVSGTAGLTAQGLLAASPAGWYPIGAGPRAQFFTLGTFNAPGTAFNRWDAAFGLAPHSYRFGGASFISVTNGSTRIQAGIAGRWNVVFFMAYGTAAGTLIVSVRSFSAAGNAQRTAQWGQVLNASTGQNITHAMSHVYLEPGGYVIFQHDAGSATVGGGDSYVLMEYVGPLLVTN